MWRNMQGNFTLHREIIHSLPIYLAFFELEISSKSILPLKQA